MILAIIITALFSANNLLADLGTPQLISPVNNALGTPQNQLLKWGAVDAADEYHLQVAEDTDFTTIVKDVVITLNEASFYSADLGVRYFWRVQAQNSQTTGLWSDFWAFNIYSNNIPNSPFVLLPYDNAVFTGNQFKTEWASSPAV